MGKATLKDVIKLAGVSLRTGSRVLNKDPTVRPATKAKVLEAMSKLGYTPDITARTLRGAKSFIIGVTYDNLNAYYIRDLLTGVLAECQANGYGLQIIPCDSSDADVLQHLRENITYSRLAGLVMSPPLSEMPNVTEALMSDGTNLSLITSGPANREATAPTVFFDDFGGAYSLTAHLISLGHENIGFLWGDAAHRTSQERHRGYIAAHNDNKIDVDPSRILEGQYSFESGFSKTTALLKLTPRVSAVFASNDEIAAGAMAAARNNGVRVPDDLSITGFEDSPFSRQSWPHLTTACLPTLDIAAAATRMLLQKLRPNSFPQGDGVKRKTFSAEPIIRDSTMEHNDS